MTPLRGLFVRRCRRIIRALLALNLPFQSMYIPIVDSGLCRCSLSSAWSSIGIQLCGNSGAWDFGYVDSFLCHNFHCLIFCWYFARSQFSAILPLCKCRRIATGSQSMARRQIGFSTRGLRTSGCGPMGPPSLSLYLPCRIWDQVIDIGCARFLSFLHSNLYFGQILEFGCGRIVHARCCICASIGTRVFQHVMSHNLNSLFV
jgi:hypothetical protein